MTLIDFHPASLLFPLMAGVDLARLVEDIREHGLVEPIVLLDGQVLDGRNRLRACEQAGVEPRFVEWSANGITPVQWVVATNLQWRRLTKAQLAALALDLLPHLEGEARERQGTRTDLQPRYENDTKFERSVDKAADLVGVGRTTVTTAKAIEKRDPEVVNRMRSGELNVGQAARIVGLEHAGNGVVLEGPVDASGRQMPAVYFGKGDKWREATEPLRRYLAAWKKRDYLFGHVAPRDARKRLETIDALIDELTEARADLAQRSHSYRLTA